jgi:hypothetical protein
VAEEIVSPSAAEKLVEPMAELIGLTIADAHRPGVATNFSRLAVIAALVMEFPLPDHTEITPIFVP